MWVTPFAITPVPRHALVTRELVREVDRSMAASDDELDEQLIVAAAERLESAQPALAARLQRLVRGSRDEAAVALGYFLMVGAWLAFERAFGTRLDRVSVGALESVHEHLRLEAELRAERSSDPLELEDVLSVQQPALFAWVAEHTESTLASSVEHEGDEVDVNDVDAVLSEVAAFILALSYAVRAPTGHSHAGALA